MKKILIILLLISQYSFATNYYVSGEGNNANTGLSDAQAWATPAKVNSVTLASGDSILFKRGYTYSGTLIAQRDNIKYGAYGTGERPIISGFANATIWTNDGGGIWHCNIPTASTSLIVVTIDDELQRIGRFPNYGTTNGGYYTYTSLNSATPSITGPALSTTTNWTGAEVVIRKNHWIMDRCIVTAHSGGTVTYTNPTGVINGPYPGKVNFGYFFQDDIRTLDQFGEWFLNKSTKDLSMYFGALNPSSYSIKVSVVDTVINLGARNNISISNIDIEGANKIAVHNKFGNTISVTNCNVNNSYNGIYLNTVYTSVIIQNDSVTNVLNNGIGGIGFSGATVNISNNYVKKVSHFAGMTGSGDANGNGIIQDGDNSTIQYNAVDSSGYQGIVFKGSNTDVRYNFISNFGFVKDDVGGIYTSSDAGATIHSDREVSYNIIINGIGATQGTPNYAAPGTTYDAHGIYFDEGTNHVYSHDNTVSVMPNGHGTFINFGTDIEIRNDNYYNVITGFNINRPGNKQLVRNIIFAKNAMYPTTQNFFYWNGSLNYPTTTTIQADMQAMFTRIDSNYYRTAPTRPFYYYYHLTNGGTFVNGPTLSLSQWQTFINQEAASINMANGTTEIKYNASGSPITYTFTGLSKKAADGTVYNNSVSIPAWSSKILIANGLAPSVNVNPTANAGANQTITLPTNTTTLTGSGTDTDGTIVGYSWVKISGANGGNYGTSTNANLIVTNLLEGVYLFELTVTDNLGAIGKDTVQVTVNANPNQNPVVNAGANQSITLPTNSVTLSGSATDDGTIVSYSWSKVSGPASYSIVTVNAATTSVINLVQGVYQFVLTATDNLGATGSDVMTVTVSPNPTPVSSSSIILYNWKFN